MANGFDEALEAELAAQARSAILNAPPIPDPSGVSLSPEVQAEQAQLAALQARANVPLSQESPLGLIERGNLASVRSSLESRLSQTPGTPQFQAAQDAAAAEAAAAQQDTVAGKAAAAQRQQVTTPDAGDQAGLLQLAGAQPGFEIVSLKGTERISPALTRAQGQRAKAQLDDAGRARQALGAETEALQGKLAADKQALVKQLGERAKPLEAQYNEFSSRLERIRKDIAENEIVPLGGFDRTSKAFLVLASAFEGIGAASLRRPSNTAAILGQAIRSDLAAQRMNLQRKLQAADLTESQQRQALQRWNAIEAQKQRAMGDMAQLQLAKLATRGKTLDARVSAIQAGTQLDAMMNPKVKSVTTPKLVQTGGAGAGRKLDKAEVRKFKENLGQFQFGERKVNQLENLVKDSGAFVRGAVAPTGKGVQIKNNLKDLALVWRKVMGDSGPIRGDDIKTFDRLGVDGFVASVINDKQALIDRIGVMRDDIREAKAREARLLLADPRQLAQEAIAGQEQAFARRRLFKGG